MEEALLEYQQAVVDFGNAALIAFKEIGEARISLDKATKGMEEYLVDLKDFADGKKNTLQESLSQAAKEL